MKHACKVKRKKKLEQRQQKILTALPLPDRMANISPLTREEIYRQAADCAYAFHKNGLADICKLNEFLVSDIMES